MCSNVGPRVVRQGRALLRDIPVESVHYKHPNIEESPQAHALPLHMLPGCSNPPRVGDHDFATKHFITDNESSENTSGHLLTLS
jgi:hypothetical protein